jgi:biotin transporter BioY
MLHMGAFGLFTFSVLVSYISFIAYGIVWLKCHYGSGSDASLARATVASTVCFFFNTFCQFITSVLLSVIIWQLSEKKTNANR